MSFRSWFREERYGLGRVLMNVPYAPTLALLGVAVGFVLGLVGFNTWDPDTRMIAITNGVLAAVAATINIWAGVRTSTALRFMFGCIATLAVFYSVAYFWLAINPTRGGEWSAFLRPFGALTWISTWSVPPLVIVKERRLRAADLEEKLGKRIQRLDYILEEGDVRG